MDKALELYARSINRMQAPIKGQGLVEYALIILLVAIVIVGSLAALQAGLAAAFADAVAAL